MPNRSFIIVILLLLHAFASADPQDQGHRISNLTLEDKYEIMLAYMTDAVITKHTDKELNGLKQFVEKHEDLISDKSSFEEFFKDEENSWSGNGLKLANYLLNDTISILLLDSLYSQVTHETARLESIWLPRTVCKIKEQKDTSSKPSNKEVQSRKSKNKKWQLSLSKWFIIILVMTLVVALLIFVIYSWSKKKEQSEAKSYRKRQKAPLERNRSTSASLGAGIGPGNNSQISIDSPLDRDIEKSTNQVINEEENVSPTLTYKVSDKTKKESLSFSRSHSNTRAVFESEKFFGAPREDGSFQMKEKKREGDPFVLYKLNGLDTGLVYLEIASSHGTIIERRNRLIEPVCEALNAFENGRHTRIKLIEAGSYVSEGDKYRVVKKVKIQYI